MTYDICSCLILLLLQIQLLTSQNRYCKEAVKSVKIVESCPSSKTEWDRAADIKNCGKKAPEQKCASVEKFKYHCVINGRRNKLMEVCAPTRIIFGHCVEFNVRGGVIQDQRSAPCNQTFLKCASIYSSSDAYKYPDCYKLVTISEVRSSTKEEPTSTIRTTTNKQLSLIPVVIAVAVLLLVLISIVAAVFIQFRKRRQCVRKTIDESKGAILDKDDSKRDQTSEVQKIKNEEELNAKLHSCGVYQWVTFPLTFVQTNT